MSVCINIYVYMYINLHFPFFKYFELVAFRIIFLTIKGVSGETITSPPTNNGDPIPNSSQLHFKRSYHLRGFIEHKHKYSDLVLHLDYIFILDLNSIYVFSWLH